MSIKALARAVLQGNKQGNHKETRSFQQGNFVKKKHPKSFHSELQIRSKDFVQFCLAHQNTWPEGQCPVKRDRVDPMSQCLGWRLKTNRLH